MWTDQDDVMFELSRSEMSVLIRAGEVRGSKVVQGRTSYSKVELLELGLVREAFNSAELDRLDVGREVISSRDEISQRAEISLGVGSHKPSKVRKWQLPLPFPGVKPVMIVFPLGSSTAEKVQPVVSDDRPGGAFRLVLAGSLECNGLEHGPMQWFYVPNGVAYSMRSSAHEDTHVLYLFDFPSAESDGRFTYEL